ncbi:hypothetical protein FISHEDRAFT_58648 [Fistulina hepatica ATCC 64428]|uniref:Retrotransposon gag domain-containing protein n=1 Tax=Fistulina hepatica ATCC 64428 TaxID=1128425 RepID=A0A0D7ADE6_9AGAR|nr:hypothetical protein FISHEDRAFT_58648 [Fistulina hepatica ATCC 64428]
MTVPQVKLSRKPSCPLPLVTRSRATSAAPTEVSTPDTLLPSPLTPVPEAALEESDSRQSSPTPALAEAPLPPSDSRPSSPNPVLDNAHSPPAHYLSDSDSSSSSCTSDSSLAMSYAATPESDATLAKLKAEPGKRPVLSAGPVTPELIFNTLAALETYFAEKDITTDKQIVAARGTLQADPIRRDWFAANETAFTQMTFPLWKQELIKEVLEPGWDHAMRTEILSACQKPDEGFKQYVHRLQRRAAYLNNTSYRIDHAILRDAVERVYAPALRDHLEVEECIDDASTARFLALPFKDWVAVVHRRDNQLKKKKQDLTAQLAALKRPAASALGEPSHRYNATPRLSTQHASASTPSGASDRPPQLTAAEKALLTENHGCYKCRVPFSGHCKEAVTKWNAAHPADQQVTPRFPDALKNVTTAIAPMPVVSTMDYDVGVVFPATSTDALYTNLTDSEDSDYVPSET